MAIRLKLYELTLQEIAARVREKCSEYGSVKSVRVYLYPILTPNDRPFALVEMAGPDEAAALKEGVGDGYYAGGVTIDLVRA